MHIKHHDAIGYLFVVLVIVLTAYGYVTSGNLNLVLDTAYSQKPTEVKQAEPILPPAPETTQARRIASRYNAEPEVRLWDGTRVDLLSPTHAYEIDWASKWAEAIGQALYYAHTTEKRPGIILLINDLDSEKQFVYRLMTVANIYNIDVFLEDVKTGKQLITSN